MEAIEWNAATTFESSDDDNNNNNNNNDNDDGNNDDNHSSSSVEKDLVDHLGPRRQDLEKVIPVTVIYVVIFFTGIVGNVSTCVVIARNRYMHTATNMCLFNLAVSDLLVILLGLPQETYSFWSAYPWVLGDAFCVFRTMAAETSTYASILTITAFTVERYVAICHPIKARLLSGLQRAGTIVVLIWVVSGVCSLPFVYQYGIVYVDDRRTGRPIPDSATCNIRPDRYLPHAFEASTFLFFVAPVTVISVLYGLIGLAIRRSALTRTGSDTSNNSYKASCEQRFNQQARTRMSVIKMLVAVVVAFFICWAPFHTQRLLTVYGVRPPALLNALLFYVSGVLYYVSAVINPILYSIMSLKFRRAFMVTICKSGCCRKQSSNKRGGTAPHAARYKFQGRLAGGGTGGGTGGGVAGGGAGAAGTGAGGTGAGADGAVALQPGPSNRDRAASNLGQQQVRVGSPANSGGTGGGGSGGGGGGGKARLSRIFMDADKDSCIYGFELNGTTTQRERHSGGAAAIAVVYGGGQQGFRQRPTTLVALRSAKHPRGGNDRTTI